MSDNTMMNAPDIKQLSPDLAVAPQITPEAIPLIAAAGFKSVICNRPDYEAGPDQPTFAAIEAAARASGLQARYIPVVSGQITEGDVRAFKQAEAELPKPILAYCRSGTRSTNMWALAGRLPD